MKDDYTLTEIIELLSGESDEINLGIIVSESWENGPTICFRLDDRYATPSLIKDLQQVLEEHDIKLDFDPESLGIKNTAVSKIKLKNDTPRVLH